MSMLEWLLGFAVVVLVLWLVSVLLSANNTERYAEVLNNRLKTLHGFYEQLRRERDFAVESMKFMRRDLEQYKDASLDYERLASQRAETIRELGRRVDELSSELSIRNSATGGD